MRALASVRIAAGRPRAHRAVSCPPKKTAARGSFIGALLVGAALAEIGSRRGYQFSWGLCWLAPLGLCVLAIDAGLLGGLAAAEAVAILLGLLCGHTGWGAYRHSRARLAGDDLPHKAREQFGPHHLIARQLAERKITERRTDEIAIGTTTKGRVAKIRRGDGSGSHCLIAPPAPASRRCSASGKQLGDGLVGAAVCEHIPDRLAVGLTA